MLNQLQQLGAASHREIPARWAQIVEDANRERARRYLPLIRFVLTGSRVEAYVNRGAWVADCPNCNGGIAVSPDWPACACLDCGHVYEALVPDVAMIEAATVLLERRKQRFQNWYPQHEPIVALQAENKVHDLDDSLAWEGHELVHHEFVHAFPEYAPTALPLRPGDLNLALPTGGV